MQLPAIIILALATALCPPVLALSNVPYCQGVEFHKSHKFGIASPVHSTPSTIPVFPPFCLVPLQETTCSGLGLSFECFEAYKKDSPFGSGIRMGHFIVFLALNMIGVAFLCSYYNRTRRIWQQSMLLFTAFYAIFTSSFALCRAVWMLSRPLFIGAALHNLFEWFILIQLFSNTVQRQKMYVVRAVTFILAIISLVSLVPNLKAVTLLEQSCGVMLDLGLPVMFSQKWLLEGRDLYKYPAIAHGIHWMFTILPLIFANFFVGEISWMTTFGLEFLVYVSTPITHILYLNWSVGFDEEKRAIQDQDMRRRHISRDEANTLENGDVLERPGKTLAVCWIIGLFFLVGIPQYVLSPCPPNNFCTADPTFYGTAVVQVYPGLEQAFEDRLEKYKLIQKGQSASGNIEYQFTRSLSNPSQYRFFEVWSSIKDVEAWINSGIPSQVFREDGPMAFIMNGTIEVAGYQKPYPGSCKDKAQLGFHVEVKASCQQVWNVVTNFKDCSWIQGCRYASIDPKNPDLRNLSMTDGSFVMEKLLYVTTDKFGYQRLPGDAVLGYEAVVSKTTSTVTGTGCGIGFQYQLHKGNNWQEQVEAMYETQQRDAIPYIRQLFANPGRWVDRQFRVEIVNGFIRYKALSSVHSSLASAARLNAPGNVSKVEIAVEDRHRALAHRWFYIVENPQRDAEPAREILAKNFSLSLSGIRINTFKAFQDWLKGPADQAKASSHVMESFQIQETTNTTNGAHELKMVVTWNGILRSNDEHWIAQTEHTWETIDHADDNFARIKNLKVRFFVPFSPLINEARSGDQETSCIFHPIHAKENTTTLVAHN